LSREVLLKSLKKKKEKHVKFYQRNSRIPLLFINKVLEISKGGPAVIDPLKALGQGPRFKNYTYKNTQLGFKLGEFSPTRRKAKHNGKKVRGLSKKRKSKNTNKLMNLKKKGFFTR
jgi:ribosomal protein S19